MLCRVICLNICLYNIIVSHKGLLLYIIMVIGYIILQITFRPAVINRYSVHTSRCPLLTDGAEGGLQRQLSIVIELVA